MCIYLNLIEVKLPYELKVVTQTDIFFLFI